MTRHWIVATLLRFYPAAWRAEYGAELSDVLLARPLGPRVIADVLWNGVRQRAKTAEPSTILGLVSILLVLAGFFSPVGPGWLQTTWRILPGPPVQFMAGGTFALLQFLCGCWTRLRHGGTVQRSGLAAMRACLIGASPFILGALLTMLGLVDAPSASLLIIAPLARLPDAWIWGALGGLLGKRFASQRVAAGPTQP